MDKQHQPDLQKGFECRQRHAMPVRDQKHVRTNEKGTIAFI